MFLSDDRSSFDSTDEDQQSIGGEQDGGDGEPRSVHESALPRTTSTSTAAASTTSVQPSPRATITHPRMTSSSVGRSQQHPRSTVMQHTKSSHRSTIVGQQHTTVGQHPKHSQHHPRATTVGLRDQSQPGTFIIIIIISHSVDFILSAYLSV